MRALLLVAACVSGWRCEVGCARRAALPFARSSTAGSAGLMMLAKNKKRAPPDAVSKSADQLEGTATSTATGPVDVEDRLDAVLKSAGLIKDWSATDATASSKDSAGGSPLANIPPRGQELLERVFFSGAALFGSVFLLAGLALSAEATLSVLGSPLPDKVAAFVLDFVEPTMTPSILCLFFFSISLGVLKQLQLGSDTAGVLYTEDDDD